MVVMESKVALKAGDAAPGFDLLGIDDKRYSLSSFKDYDATLVVFMCNHCPYVKAKVPAISEIHEKFKGRVAVVGINSNDAIAYPDDSFDSMKEFARERKIGFFYLVDETQEIAKKYGAVCTPDPFLFDASGKLVYHGRIDSGASIDTATGGDVMEASFKKVLDGEKITEDFLPSQGCSIKWKGA